MIFGKKKFFNQKFIFCLKVLSIKIVFNQKSQTKIFPKCILDKSIDISIIKTVQFWQIGS